MLRADVFALIPAAVIILIVAGVIYVQANQTKFLGTANNSPTPSISPSPSPSPSVSPSPTAKPAANVSININENSNNGNSNNNLDINQFKYPGASVNSSSATSLTLTSSEDSDKITEWYKEKIRSLGMNTKSFVSTKTNGNVENKLVGDNGKNQVSVEIKKGANESTVRIHVSIS